MSNQTETRAPVAAAHTPEPWEVRYLENATPDRVLLMADGVTLGELCRPFSGWPEHIANARRIVAAVNACAGIATAALESGVPLGFRSCR